MSLPSKEHARAPVWMARLAAVQPSGWFVAAGLVLWAGNMCGATEWGDSLAAGLGLVAVAMALLLLGFRGLSAERGPSVAAAAPVEDARQWPLLAGLIAVHCVAAAIVCAHVRPDTIDTYTFQQDSMARLAHGTDPFGGTHRNIYTAVQSARFYGPGLVSGDTILEGLQYPPLTLLWILPGYLAGDIRYSYVAAIALSAALLYACRPSRRAWWLAAFLLLNPMTFYVEHRCFTEPLVLLLASAVAFAALQRPRWLAVALGLFLASKQYNVVALPLVALLVAPLRWRQAARLAVPALAVVALTLAPFAVWDPRALWHDLVVFHRTQPFRDDAMSFAVPWHGLLRAGLPLLLAFLAWAVWKLRGVGSFLAAYGFAVLLFFAFGKQAFANYYFLMTHVVLLAAVVLDGAARGGEYPRGGVAG